MCHEATGLEEARPVANGDRLQDHATYPALGALESHMERREEARALPAHARTVARDLGNL